MYLQRLCSPHSLSVCRCVGSCSREVGISGGEAAPPEGLDLHTRKRDCGGLIWREEEK